MIRRPVEAESVRRLHLPDGPDPGASRRLDRMPPIPRQHHVAGPYLLDREVPPVGRDERPRREAGVVVLLHRLLAHLVVGVVVHARLPHQRHAGRADDLQPALPDPLRDEVDAVEDRLLDLAGRSLAPQVDARDHVVPRVDQFDPHLGAGRVAPVTDAARDRLGVDLRRGLPHVAAPGDPEHAVVIEMAPDAGIRIAETEVHAADVGGGQSVRLGIHHATPELWVDQPFSSNVPIPVEQSCPLNR